MNRTHLSRDLGQSLWLDSITARPSMTGLCTALYVANNVRSFCRVSYSRRLIIREEAI